MKVGRDYSVMSYFTPEGVDAGARGLLIREQEISTKIMAEWHIGVQLSDTVRTELGSGQEEGW